MMNRRSMAFSVQFLAASMPLSTAAFAEEVTLESSDGTANMTGTFVDFRDNSYIVSTELSEMRVSATRVDCFGVACPDLDAGEA
jgi:hypothetical protein